MANKTKNLEGTTDIPENEIDESEDYFPPKIEDLIPEEKQSTQEIRDFVEQELHTDMREIYKIRNNLSLLHEPENNDLAMTLGKAGVLRNVEREYRLKEIRGTDFLPTFRLLAQRIKDGKLEDGDVRRIKGFAEDELVRIWNSYYNAVYEETYNNPFTFLNGEFLTEEQLFPSD